MRAYYGLFRTGRLRDARRWRVLHHAGGLDSCINVYLVFYLTFRGLHSGVDGNERPLEYIMRWHARMR